MAGKSDSGKGGRRQPGRLGVREIAKRVGVAPMTVSRALSNPDLVSPETRAKVLQAIEASGFVPNRLASSMRGSGRMIGTVVPPLINSGIAEQVQGMSDECHESDYSMLLVQGEFTPEAEENSIRTLLGWRPAGMILQSFVQSDAARALLKRSGAPVVEISEIKGRKPLDMVVGVSNFETAYAMTMHLATKGYKRIGFVSTPIHGNDRLQQRRTGYHAALSDDAASATAPWRRQVATLASITLPAALGIGLLSWFGAATARRARGLSQSLGITSARYRSLVESSPDGILVVQHGRIEYANPALGRLARCSDAASLVGRPVAALLGAWSEQHASGDFDGPPVRVVSVDHWLRPDEGSPIEVQTLIAPRWAGDDASIQIVVRDISARKQAERRLRESEQRYRVMVQGMPDAAFLLLDPDGLIEDVSPATSRAVLGRRRELLGRSLDVLGIVGPNGVDHPSHVLLQVGIDGRPVEREGWCQRTDGARFWAHIVISGLTDEREEVRGFHVLVRDIGARKRLQDQLKASRRKLESLAIASEAAREREKIRMARELHDELGQVLTVQQMDVEMLGEELGTGAPHVRQRIAAMRERIEQALTTTRRIAGDLRPLVLDDLGLIAALEWLLAQARSRSGIDGQIEVTGDIAGLRGDLATTVFRIAQESLTNVMRHAGARHVKIQVDIDAAWVALRVTDDGRGLDPGDARRGLGLLGMEERARLLGGQAVIERRQCRGTIVRVRLPASGGARNTVEEKTE